MVDPSLDLYSPLTANSVRLLSLSTIDGSSVALKVVDLDEAPPYFALSYAWGEQTRNVHMQVNGHMLSVSPSLVDAIQQLQTLAIDGAAFDSHVHWVWIDKICINQDDFSERSRQVQMMNLIYSRASRTLIWLGSNDSTCSAAWGLIDQIYGVFRRENPCPKSIAEIPFRLYSDKHHAAYGLPGWDHHMWRHLRRLFKLPWFTRTWIIQEVALSRGDPMLLHGKYTYPWHRLGWASTWLRRSGYLRLPQVPNGMQNVDAISNIQRSGACWNLDALLVNTSIKCHATDQRDKLYGLLGLAVKSRNPPSIPEALCPDYKLGIVKVYTKVALFFLQEYKSLGILTRATGVLDDVSRAQRTHQLDLLPSWVPNWCDYSVVEREVAKSFSWVTAAGVLGFPAHYNASTGLPVRLFISSNASVLRLGGLKADTVISATQFDQRLEPLGQLACNNPLLQLLEAALPFLPEGKALIDWIASWVITTTADQHLLSGRTEKQILRDGSAYLHNLLSSNEYQQSSQTSLSFDPEVTESLRKLSTGGDPEIYRALASNFCLNRKFIITLEGRMGITPTGTQPGDVIFVLFGGGVPYILRKQGRSFLFVGESYVHGIMGGDVVEAWERGEVVEETVELR